MPRFFARLAVGRLDIPDLLARTDDLAAFVRGATDRYGLDATRIVAVGLSNGANIAVSLLFRHPGLLRGAVLLRPMLPYEPQAPLSLDGNRRADRRGGGGSVLLPGAEPAPGRAAHRGRRDGRDQHRARGGALADPGRPAAGPAVAERRSPGPRAGMTPPAAGAPRINGGHARPQARCRCVPVRRR